MTEDNSNLREIYLAWGIKSRYSHPDGEPWEHGPLIRGYFGMRDVTPGETAPSRETLLFRTRKQARAFIAGRRTSGHSKYFVVKVRVTAEVVPEGTKK